MSSTSRRRLRRHPRRHRRRRLRRPCRRRHRQDLHAHPGCDDPGRVPRPLRSRPGRGRRASRAAPPSGLTPRSRSRPQPARRPERLPTPRPRTRSCGCSSGSSAREASAPAATAATSRRTMPGPARRLARLDRPAERPGADRDDAGGGLLPRGLFRRARAAPTIRGCARPRRARAPSRTRDRPVAGHARRGLRRLHAGRPLPALDGVPRPRARQAAGRDGERPRVALVVDGDRRAARRRAHDRAHPRAGRSRLRRRGRSAPIAASTAGCPPSPRSTSPSTRAWRPASRRCPSLVETLTEGRFDLIHLVTPGPAGVAAALTARIAGLPLLASHHTEFVAYARMRTGNESLAVAMGVAMSLFYRDCGIVLSPSTSADASLEGLGVAGRADRPLGARRRHSPASPPT